MNAALSNEDIAPILFDVLSLGMSHADNRDLTAVLRLLREVRPKALEIVLVLAWELLKGLESDEARRLLEEADFQHPDNPRIKATLASVLFFTDVSLWKSYAAEVRRLPHDEEAAAILAAIESADDQRLPGALALVGFRMPKAVEEIARIQNPQYA
jgi:thioredoxin-like negative regulator of GroEL